MLFRSLESVINSALGLPGTGGVVVTAPFSPKLTGSAVVPTTTTTAAPTTTTTPSLPRTGTSTAPLALVGLALVAGGAAMALRSRRSTVDA